MSETPATTVESAPAVRRSTSCGSRSGISFVLTGDPVTIGRSPQCTIFLNDMTVSRMHATIEQETAATSSATPLVQRRVGEQRFRGGPCAASG
ncbi:MAG: FHA domain-containing protein [Adlercreutzia equolifaciens]